MSKGSAISVEGLVKDFKGDFWKPKVRVLHGIDLEVRKGVLFGFIGPNGAGKSTTIKVLLDILRPTSGKVELFGMPPSDRGARAKIGFLPENPFFYDYLTGREFLDFYASMFPMTKGERKRRVDYLIDRVGLSHAADRALRKYSKGMLQRIGIAQAIVNDPELVILDEPMTGLDPMGRRDVRELILDLNAQGKTVFFSTHILSDAEEICDQVALVVKGKVRASGNLSELLAGKSWTQEVELRDITFETVEKFCAPLGCEVHRRPSGGVAVVLGEGKVLEDLFKFVYQNRGRIISVKPLRRSLESVFVEYVTEDATEEKSESK